MWRKSCLMKKKKKSVAKFIVSVFEEMICPLPQKATYPGSFMSDR